LDPHVLVTWVNKIDGYNATTCATSANAEFAEYMPGRVLAINLSLHRREVGGGVDT
jgi:hypothetical protein